MGRAVAEQLPASCRRPQPAGHPLVVTQADRSSRPTGGALGGLDEETAFVENDVDCEADIILGYDWLRAHDLALLSTRMLSASAPNAAARRAAASAWTLRSTRRLRRPRASRLPRPARS